MTHDELDRFITWPGKDTDSHYAFRALLAAINLPIVYVEKFDDIARGTNIGSLRLYDDGELWFPDHNARTVTNFSKAQMVLLKIAINKRIAQDRMVQAIRRKLRTR